MIRTLGKTAFACAYTWSGAAYWGSRTQSGTLPFMVGYHRVVDDFVESARHSIPSMLISTKMFERHLDWLGKRFQVVGLDELGAALESGRSFRRPTAAITFDDGYGDVYRNAYPVLLRKGMPAAVFVVTDLVGTPELQVYDKLYLLLSGLHGQGGSLGRKVCAVLDSLGLECRELLLVSTADAEPFRVMTMLLTRFPQSAIERLTVVLDQFVPLKSEIARELTAMSWENVAEMQRNGFTIGSHTSRHTLLPEESLSRVNTELVESKRTLETRLGAEIKHFAYPDGRFNASSVDAVKAAGYKYGFTICGVRDSRHPMLTIPRRILWERAAMNVLGGFSSAVMNCHANNGFDGFRRCQHDHGVGYSCREQLIAV